MFRYEKIVHYGEESSLRRIIRDSKVLIPWRLFQGSDVDVIRYLIEQGAGGKKVFVENKKEQTVIDIAEQWCDYDSYVVLKDHFDSIAPPKVRL